MKSKIVFLFLLLFFPVSVFAQFKQEPMYNSREFKQLANSLSKKGYYNLGYYKFNQDSCKLEAKDLNNILSFQNNIIALPKDVNLSIIKYFFLIIESENTNTVCYSGGGGAILWTVGADGYVIKKTR